MSYLPQLNNALKQGTERAKPYVTLKQRLQILFQDGERDVTIKSLGEYALPFFLAAVEACWLDGILIGLAGLDLLDSRVALLPFWAPLLLLLGAMWLFRRTLQHESSRQGSATAQGRQGFLHNPDLHLMFGLIGLLTLILIWLQIYAVKALLFDPRWLFILAADMIALNVHFYQTLFIIGCAIYLCWRAMRLAQLAVEPNMVFKQMGVGLLIFLVVILLRANQANVGTHADDVILLLLIPFFLYLALSAHALARVSWIRRDHPFGLQGSVVAQERAMLSVITLVGVALFGLTLIGGSVFSPAFFSALQTIWHGVGIVYNWLTTLFSQFAVLLITPLIWLAKWWFAHFPNRFPTIHPPPANAPPPRVFDVGPTSPSIVLTVKILLPLLIFLALVLLVRWTLRKRKRLRLTLNQTGGDLHESVWSWRLFWSQVYSVLLTRWTRLFPKRAKKPLAPLQEELGGPPAVRTVREIYRALLHKAASRGLIRKRDETPYEFQRRLDRHEAQSEPQLGLLTLAYTQTRYGGNVPDEEELTMFRQSWDELAQKWEASLHE